MMMFHSPCLIRSMPIKGFYAQVLQNVQKCTTCWPLQHVKFLQQHLYKPKAVKLQGRIPFRQNCCKKCQNFQNVINEAVKNYVECLMILVMLLIEQCVIIKDIFQSCLVYYIPVMFVVKPNFKKTFG